MSDVYATPRGQITLKLPVAPITWKKAPENFCDECYVGDRLTAWLTNRPSYCDRGHFMVDCNLPDIDRADSFPRYYMSRDVAIAETEAWLKWRLWKQRGLSITPPA